MKIRPFNLGKLVATPACLDVVPMERIAECIHRHAAGDWGVCCKDDWRANDLATLDGSRIFSVYWIDELNHDKGKWWCITEAEGYHEDGVYRQSTCCLLPENY